MRVAFSKPHRDPQEWTTLLGFRSAGYEGLQLKRYQYEDHLAAPEAFRERYGADPGLVSGLIHFGPLDPDGIATLDSTVEFAAAVGSERVIFCHDHPHAGVTRGDRERFAATLGECGRRARDLGVALSLHHHDDQPVMVTEDAREFFGALPDATVGLTVDTAHLAKSGVHDIPGFLAEFAGVIDNIHLKDFDGDWRLLGDGSLDLDGILAQLARQRYASWLCVDEETATPMAEAMRRSRDWLDAHLPAEPREGDPR